MTYFAYGSNMFTYRLEKRVGRTKVIGPGRLTKYKLEFSKPSKDGSLKASIFHTGNDEDFVLGILFEIKDSRKSDLDKAEGLGAGYETRDVLVEVLATRASVNALTYIVDGKQRTLLGLPYDWYVQLIVAGAEEHYLDLAYIDMLKSTKSAKDSNPGRESTSLFILSESSFTRKCLAVSVEWVNELTTKTRYTISLAGHALDNREIAIEKVLNEFVFQTTSQIPPGTQTHRELNVSGRTLTLTKGPHLWLVEGRHFLLKDFGYDFDNLLKLLSGRITGISSSPASSFDDKFLRLMMPIKEALRIQPDYQFAPFTRDYILGSGMLVITIDGKPFHFYSFKGEDGYFLVIDCLGTSKFHSFQIACNAILMTYSFLSGNCNAGEAYCLSFDDAAMEIPTGISFYMLGTFAQALDPVFTTNRHIGLNTEAFTDREMQIVTPEDRQNQYPQMALFPAQVFGSICQFAFEDDKVLRTLNHLMNYHVDSLEMKLSIQYVTLETITAAIAIAGNKHLKPIKDDKLAGELIAQLQADVVAFAKKHSIDVEELTPITKTIANINKPPNIDKLSRSFEILGYSLTPEEKKIIGHRDKFLHGSIVTFGGLYEDYKELLHISLRLHFLIAVLLLKKAGFIGRLINYAKLYEHITGKDLDEEVFKMI